MSFPKVLIGNLSNRRRFREDAKNFLKIIIKIENKTI